MNAMLFRKIDPVAQRLNNFGVIVLNPIAFSIGEDGTALRAEALK